eukprot:m51a1_g7911 hypothetical protein (691) ;mRNA; f:177760-181405
MPHTEFGLTKFADLTKEEFAARYLNADVPKGLSKLEAHLSRKVTRPVADLPSSWIAPTVTPVRDQGHCGSCWAFATTAVMESAWFGSTGNMTQFSTQQLVDCDTSSHGCKGGSARSPYDYAIGLSGAGGGLETEEDYPYTAEDGKCVYDASRAVGRFSHVFFVDFVEDKVDSDLFENGPLSFGLDATVLQLYKSGVIEDTPECLNQANHLVVLIGWGTDANGQYWVVKNSWGESWGEKGWFRIRRGVGACEMAAGPAVGITVDPCVPTTPECKIECGEEYDGCSKYVRCGVCKQEGITCGVDHTCIDDWYDGPNVRPDLGTLTTVSPSFPYAFFKFDSRSAMNVDEAGWISTMCFLNYSFVPEFGAPWEKTVVSLAGYLGIWNSTYHWYAKIPMSEDNALLEATAWCSYGLAHKYFPGHNDTARYLMFRYEASASSGSIRAINDDTDTIGVVQRVSANEAAKIAVTVAGHNLGSIRCTAAYSVLDRFGDEWADVHETRMQGEHDSWFLALEMPAAGRVLEAKDVARFGEWARKHGKVYTTNEHSRRLGVFLHNEQVVAQLNQRHQGSATFAMNHFGDLTAHEFRSLMAGSRHVPQDVSAPRVPNETVREARRVSGSSVVAAAPDWVDWRVEGAVNEVRQQGSCGAGYAFASTAAIEASCKIQTGTLWALSEQNVIDCSENSGCSGGLGAK